MLKLILCSWQEFAAAGSSNTDTGKASGSLETKYKIKEYGLTFTQKWNTDNTLGTEVSMEDQVRGSRYPENVSATGMRKSWAEQKTLKSESCTKLCGVLKRKKLCIFAECTNWESASWILGAGGCKHSHSTCCYVMMSYCSYRDAKLASWLNEHHYYPLQIGVFV